jgi:peroxiredoxin
MVGFKSDVRSEIVEAERRAVADLVAAGAAGLALKAGDRMPAIVLPESEGRTVESSDLLRRGPLVVAFHRGLWCAFANTALQALEGVCAEVEARGASVVTITQQTAANARKSRQLNGLGFSVLVDRGGEVTARFGLRWQLQAYLREAYEMFDVDLGRYNGEKSWALPMPAFFVVGTDGVICYAEVDPDATRPLDPRNVLPVLDRIKGSGAG